MVRDNASGLGLLIVAAIAEGHRGALTIEAGPTGGARVVLTLPETRRRSRAGRVSRGLASRRCQTTIHDSTEVDWR